MPHLPPPLELQHAAKCVTLDMLAVTNIEFGPLTERESDMVTKAVFNAVCATLAMSRDTVERFRDNPTVCQFLADMAEQQASN